ncbi:MAG: sodium:solute symporter, partial [Kiritimatiellales bacterium]
VPGGLGEIIRTGLADHKLTYAEMLTDGSIAPLNWNLIFSEKTASVLLLMALLNGIVYMCSDQNLVQRYCAAKSEKEAKKALWITCWTSLPIWAYFCFLGTAMYVFFKYFPTEKAMAILHGTNGAKAEEILPYFVTNYLPVGMAGLVVASCLAAAMSSLDSSINSVSTVFVNDLYRRYLKPNRSDRHYLKIAHLSAVFASLFMVGGAALLVIVPTKTLQDTMLQMMAFLNNGITIIFILGLFTKIGSIRTLIPGIITVYLFKAWIIGGTSGLIPETLRIPIDNYYVGIAAETLGMIIVLILSGLTAIRKRTPLNPSASNAG